MAYTPWCASGQSTVTTTRALESTEECLHVGAGGRSGGRVRVGSPVEWTDHQRGRPGGTSGWGADDVGPMRACGSRKTTVGTGRAGRGGVGLAAGPGWGLKGRGWSRS